MSWRHPYNIVLHLIFAAIPCIAGTKAMGSDDDDKDTIQHTIYLNRDVVITARRIETLDFNRPEAVTTLNREDLNFYLPPTSPDALSLIPGAFVQKTNLGGGSPFIRGLTGYHTLILIDGIRLNNSIFRSGPNQYLNTIDPFILQKVEVMKGGGSTQYGSDAIGGTMHLITKTPEFSDQKFKMGLNMLGKYWNRDMEKTIRSEITGKSRKFVFLSGISYKDFGDIKAGNDTGILVPTGYDEFDTDVKVRVKLSEGSLLEGAYQFTRQGNVPLYHKVVTGEYDRYDFDPQQRSLGYLKYKQVFDNRLFRSIHMSVSIQNSLEKRNKQKVSSEELEVERDRISVLGSDLMVQSHINDQWTAITGFDTYMDFLSSKKTIYDQESGNTTNTRGLYPDGSRYYSYGLYTLHTIEWNRFFLNGGIRYNIYNILLTDSIFGDLSLLPQAFSGNMGLTYKLNYKKHLSFLINSGYRAPNINDVSAFGIADFRYEVPAYDLKPERSINGEVGYKQSADKFSLSATVYYNRLYNLIINRRASYNGLDSLEGYQVYKRQNVGEAYIMGSELEFEWLTSEKLLLNAYVAYTFGQNITDQEPLRRIPPLYGGITGKYFIISNFEMSANFNYAFKQTRLSGGDIDDDRIPEGGTPGWMVLDFYSRYSFSKFQTSAGIKNIFNSYYKTHGSGIPGVGRSIWISLGIFL